VLLLVSTAHAADAAWQRHAIDNSSRGADGVRFADVDRDGLPDITTGWEQGGVIRVYRNPGPQRAREAWPAVSAGRVKSPEDAVLVDLDSDGALDVVSSTEGAERTLYVHWGPKDRSRYWQDDVWKTEAIPASTGAMQWMFAAALDVDGENGVDIIAAGKNENAVLGWWESPKDARRLSEWRWHALRPVGWIMSIITVDMDGDGDKDLLCSDRRGPRSGVFWMENPGKTRAKDKWREHPVGAAGREVMFISRADVDGDGLEDVISAVKPQEIHWHRRLSRDGRRWQQSVIPMPADTGTAKSVTAGDLDGDGKPEIVFSSESTPEAKSGVMGLRLQNGEWQAFAISGWPGVKYDLVELLDVDGDGDPDVITCEETSNLGVVWFENPARTPATSARL